ncbi:MAG: acyl transferase [Bacteriovorax sp.]|nr:acyl transferase [Bacteriovorax sp.]
MTIYKDDILNFLFKRLQHFFPLIFFSLMLFLFAQFVLTKCLIFFVLFCIVPYLLPLFIQRIVLGIYPLKEGGNYIGLAEKSFSPWLFSLRIQQIYLVFPQLERLLFFLPGLYSAWLRAWGSQIGKSVFWTPGTVVNDRGLMEVGDFVIFGHNTYMSSHLLRVKNGNFFVYVRKIKIGSYTFVGAFTKMGPGTNISSGSQIQAMSNFSVNQKFPATSASKDTI